MKVFNVLKKLSFLLLVVVICSFKHYNNLQIETHSTPIIAEENFNNCLRLTYYEGTPEYIKLAARVEFSKQYDISFISRTLLNGDNEEWIIAKGYKHKTIKLKADDDDGYGVIVSHEFFSCNTYDLGKLK